MKKVLFAVCWLTLVCAFYLAAADKAFSGSAPARIKAVCVVADFPDRKFEDSGAAGFRTMSQLESILSTMSEHWAWMSRGRQTMEWSVVRITLDAALADSAGLDWYAFRAQVVARASIKIDFSRYDADGDGELDVMWIVGSTGTLENAGFGLGGAALVAAKNAAGTQVKANTFYDGQGSGSSAAGAYGNFNHEAGHCLGLVDIYGAYDRVRHLSLMSDSWPVPANGFSAFDRLMLGWIEPEAIRATRNGIVLSAAETSLDCVRISTGRSSEYFLLEYRVKPSDGFGSSSGTPLYRGVAVYRVDMKRLYTGNSTDKPLLSIVSPRGESDFMPAPDDLLFPGNPYSTGPLDLALSDGTPSGIRIELASFSEDQAVVDVSIDESVRGRALPSANLVADGSFETAEALELWRSYTWLNKQGTYSLDGSVARTGSRSVCIASASTEDDVRLARTFEVRPGASYRLSGWIRTRGVSSSNGDCGANLSIEGGFERSNSVAGDSEWMYAELYFDALERTSVDICLRLGFYGSTARGEAWFDDIEFVEE